MHTSKESGIECIFLTHTVSECILFQALFRKIAASLPGMENLCSEKQNDMVDVNLRATNAHFLSRRKRKAPVGVPLLQLRRDEGGRGRNPSFGRPVGVPLLRSHRDEGGRRNEEGEICGVSSRLWVFLFCGRVAMKEEGGRRN
ncbi:hypothetical protein ZIOFF_000325 [Zingiber officinale]|uniref:Uncharacterized protein n=1 Tax=Zingiber officinale TaxID=94328 RepID=A0A8J5I4F8_ZINOF|nr:hypothetical protein ZIOFF_000325 [Zingiber officinale]